MDVKQNSTYISFTIQILSDLLVNGIVCTTHRIQLCKKVQQRYCVDY